LIFQTKTKQPNNQPNKNQMKKITLKEAYRILEDASAIIIDDSVLVYPSLSELQEDDTSEFMYLSWTDEGCDYSARFEEWRNQEVEVVGSSMFLYAEGDSEHTQITILTTKELE
jgi:hypothetical protein